ncbi:Serine/threonine-protein kinase psk1 [Seiridium cupressi]
MLPAPAPALTTVRGFGTASVASGDDDSDYCATPPLSARRVRSHRIDDVVSANCSPLLRGRHSPAVSGIAKLRMQLEPLSLNDSRASTMTVFSDSRATTMTRTNSQQSAFGRSDDDMSENGSTSYEIALEHEFTREWRNWFLFEVD